MVGTQYLLANVEEAVGNAMLNADTGSLRVVRIGEKGNVWVEIEATGVAVANYAAHVHLGRNAVDALVDALGAVRGLGGFAICCSRRWSASSQRRRPGRRRHQGRRRRCGGSRSTRGASRVESASTSSPRHPRPSTGAVRHSRSSGG